MMNPIFSRHFKVAICAITFSASMLTAGCQEPSDPASNDQHLVKAQSFIKGGQLSAARIEIMNAHQAKPNDPAAYFLMSELFESMGSLEESLEQLNKGLSLFPEPPREKIFKRIRLELMIQSNTGINERLDAISPADASEKAEIVYLKAFLLINKKQYDDAKVLLNQALSILPAHIDALLFLAKLSARDSDFDTANTLIDKAINIDKNNVDSLILKGQVALKQKAYITAEESFTYALLSLNKLDIMTPKKYTILSGLVLALNKLGQQDKAIRYTEILAKSRPGKLKSRYKGALAALSDRDITKAQGELEKALALAPSHAPSNYLLGMTKLGLGDLETAEKHLSTALEGGYIPEKTRLALVLTRIKLKQIDEAQQLVDLGLKESPENPTYLALRGTVLSIQGKEKEAQKAFQNALDKNSDFVPALNGLAKSYENLGDINASKDQLLLASMAAPNNAQLLASLIKFGLRNNQTDWALKEIKKLPALKDAFPAAPLVLSAYYLQVQDLRQSQKYLDKAEAIKPDSPLVKRLSSNLYMAKARVAVKTGNKKEALSLLNHATSAAPKNLKAHILKAGLLSKDGNIQGAIEIAKHLQSDKQFYPTGLELEGNIWAEAAQFKKASSSFETLWETNKNGKLALKIYRIKKEYSDTNAAMKHIREWVNNNPDALPPITALAMLEQENNNKKMAITLYEKALVIKADNPLILNNLSYIYYEEDNPRALELAAKAYALAPKSAAIADTYGWILIENDQLDKGLPILEQAAKAASTAKEILQHYSEALTRAGKLEEAGQVMEQITKL